MNCPSCGDSFSLKQLLRYWWLMKQPHWLFERRERLEQVHELEELKRLYSREAKLTEREQHVCASLVMGKSLDDVAMEMNVTRERIRQILSKALRKLKRAEEFK